MNLFLRFIRIDRYNEDIRFIFLVNEDNRIEETKEMRIRQRREENMCYLYNIMSSTASRETRPTTEHDYRAETEIEEMRTWIFITRTHEPSLRPV